MRYRCYCPESLLHLQFFSVCTIRAEQKKKDVAEETEGQTSKNTMMMVKLESIADDIKDIKRESRENRESIGSLRERIANVEQSVKSCHKRLDGVMKTDQ